MAAPDPEQIRIYLLGRFEIVRGPSQLAAAQWRRHKAATLLQQLVLARRLPKEQAIDALWPEAGLSSGSNNLYRTLYALRQELNGVFGPEADAAFFSFSNGVLFLDEAVWVDAQAFEQLAGAPAPSKAERQQAHALYQGDLLPEDPYSDWLAQPRAALRRLHHENCLALAGAYEAEQAYPEAIALLTPLVPQEPLDERLHRRLMRLYARSGQFAAAVRQYHICAQTLETELGVEPEAETGALLEAIQSKQLAPAAVADPLPPADEEAAPVRRHNLPAFPDRFVGRAAEIEQVRQRLAEPGCRLLTLRGIGGIGKTRLAVEAAGGLVESEAFADGLFFVNLAGIDSTDYFVPAIANTLNLALADAGDPLEQLLGYLRAREMLLILDNFEHLQQAAPQLSLLLQQCPRLTLLVTSRHQLRLAGEHVLVLDGLPTRGNRRSESGAAALFYERARQLGPGRDLEADRLLIQAICRLVAGMPLAIEMCAAWAGMLSGAEILAAIQQGLDLLESQRVDAPDRHLSIRAVFRASFNLLTAAEQAALLTLAVFQGQFSHEAAWEVAGASLPRLRALVEKSLLGARAEQGETRYQMHPLLRQFALEQITAEALAEGQRRQAHYFARLLAGEAQKRCTPHNQEIVTTVFLEADNLRSVWQWLGGQIGGEQAPATIAQLLDQLLPAWSYAYFARTQVLEGKQLLHKVWEPLLAAGWETASEPALRATFARVAVVYGRFCTELSQFEEAIAASRRGIALLEALGEADGDGYDDAISYGLRTWARALMRLGDEAGAEARLQESVARAQALPVRAGAIHTLGLIYNNRGEYAQARHYLSEALALFEQCHEQQAVLTSTLAIGSAFGRERRFAEAVERYEQVARLARRLGQKGLLMIALNNMAFCLNKMGRPGRIAAYYEEALAVAVELGRQRWQSVIAQDFGLFLLEQGETERAGGLIQEGLQLAVALNSRPDVMAGLLPVAHWQAQHGRFVEALVVAGYLVAHEMTNEEIRSYAADLWEELASELPPVFRERAERRLETATLDEILGIMEG